MIRVLLRFADSLLPEKYPGLVPNTKICGELVAEILVNLASRGRLAAAIHFFRAMPKWRRDQFTFRFLAEHVVAGRLRIADFEEMVRNAPVFLTWSFGIEATRRIREHNGIDGMPPRSF